MWFAPFLCIGLMVVGLLRPLPKFTVPEHYRAVVDAEGTKVPIEEPFRGTILISLDAGGYLEITKSPDTLTYAGGTVDRSWFGKEFMSRIYPQVLQRGSLWDPQMIRHGHGPYAELESILASDGGAYLGSSGDLVPLLRRVGLPALYTNTGKEKDENESEFVWASVVTSLIGHPDRGAAVIAHYQQAFTDIASDLNESTLPNRPRVLVMGAESHEKQNKTPNIRSLYIKSTANPYQLYILRAGATNASEGWTSEQPEAERILAMDPDFIFLMWWGQDPQEFMHDPRWRGLRAVRERRVYRLPGNPGGGGLMGLIFQPISVRWMAEIVHPDRLQPKTRQVMRDTYLREFGYRMSDKEIDEQLQMNVNQPQPDYGRFARNY
jgi:ABC-type Fe3+-hydroxamate transport system substrate-binding protein